MAPLDSEIAGDEDVVQWRLRMMTTQRFANLLEVADIVGDMQADGIEILRKIGEPEYKNLRKFMREGRPETFEFLAGLRSDEVGELNSAIENARAFRRAGKLVRWGIVTLFGAFVGMSIIWDKVASWIKASR